MCVVLLATYVALPFEPLASDWIFNTLHYSMFDVTLLYDSRGELLYNDFCRDVGDVTVFARYQRIC